MIKSNANQLSKNLYNNNIDIDFFINFLKKEQECFFDLFDKDNVYTSNENFLLNFNLLKIKQSLGGFDYILEEQVSDKFSSFFLLNKYISSIKKNKNNLFKSKFSPGLKIFNCFNEFGKNYQINFNSCVFDNFSLNEIDVKEFEELVKNKEKINVEYNINENLLKYILLFSDKNQEIIKKLLKTKIFEKHENLLILKKFLCISEIFNIENTHKSNLFNILYNLTKDISLDQNFYQNVANKIIKNDFIEGSIEFNFLGIYNCEDYYMDTSSFLEKNYIINSLDKFDNLYSYVENEYPLNYPGFTFNCDKNESKKILEFYLNHYKNSVFHQYFLKNVLKNIDEQEMFRALFKDKTFYRDNSSNISNTYLEKGFFNFIDEYKVILKDNLKPLYEKNKLNQSIKSNKKSLILNKI